MEACTELQEASRVPLNVDKCQAVPLSAPSRLIQPLTSTVPPTRVAGCGFLIPPLDNPPKLFEVPLTADYEQAKKLAFARGVGGMIAATETWSPTKLNAPTLPSSALHPL